MLYARCACFGHGSWRTCIARTDKQTDSETDTDGQTLTDRHTRARVNHEDNELGTMSPAIITAHSSTATRGLGDAAQGVVLEVVGVCRRPVGCGGA